MDTSSLLLELYGRIPPLVQTSIEGVDLDELTQASSPGRNSIAWLIWHLARIQDHHVSALLGEEQIWITENWSSQFGLEPDPSNTGYGHSAEEVARVRPVNPGVLLEYFEPVDHRTRMMLEHLTQADLDRVVDRRWDPPVTMGVRLISVADDSLQHLGQAAFVRGLLDV
jgi:hypothetical protein